MECNRDETIYHNVNIDEANYGVALEILSDTTLKRCKDEFKEFERQDVKHREDLKHVKQKIKKMDEKAEKDTVKITEITRQSEESTDLIPKIEEDIPKLQKKFLDEDKILEEILESSKAETETFHTEVANVRGELKPWEKQLIEHQGKLEVASTEKKLLSEKVLERKAEDSFTFIQVKIWPKVFKRVR